MSGVDIFERLHAYASKELVFLAEPEGERSYRELIEAIGSLCGWLDSAMVGPGDRIAIASNDAFAVAVCAFAALVEGVTVVMLPSSDHGQPIRQRLAATGCKAALVDGPNGAELITTGATPLARLLSRRSAVAFSSALTSAKPRAPRLAAGADNSAVVIFSSGSTGAPKGVRWS